MSILQKLGLPNMNRKIPPNERLDVEITTILSSVARLRKLAGKVVKQNKHKGQLIFFLADDIMTSLAKYQTKREEYY